MPEQEIEDYIIGELPSDDQKIALDFIEYLRSSGMEFVRNTGDCWKTKSNIWQKI